MSFTICSSEFPSSIPLVVLWSYILPNKPILESSQDGGATETWKQTDILAILNNTI